MEGGLVSVKKVGSTITTTVVTDAQGRYRFPGPRLTPGPYAFSIRAVGYELEGRRIADVGANGPVTADLRLRKTQDLAAQLTNAEWLASMPGTEDQKKVLLGCVQCHTLERTVRSTHDAAGFLKVQQRMGTYVNQSTPLHIQVRRAERLLEMRGEERQRARQALAEFLSTVNLKGGSTWPYELKTLPRPTGRGTRVVITEYDLPRATIQPHDVIVDPDGIAWYCNFGEQTLGKLDPRTGRVTEYRVPELKPGFLTGALSVRFDRDSNLWLGLMFQGGIAKFNRKTEAFSTWSLPPEVNRDMTQVNMTSPYSSHVDGKVWTNNNGFAAVHRLDLASASSRRGSRSARASPKAGTTTSTTSSPTRRTTCTSPTSPMSTSGASTARPASSRSSRSRRRARRRVARRWTPATASGSPSIAATRSGCSTRAPRPSPSGRLRALGRSPTTSSSTSMARPGPARCSTIGC